MKTNIMVSPSKYRTRASVKAEMAQSPTKDSNFQRRQSPRRMISQEKENGNKSSPSHDCAPAKMQSPSKENNGHRRQSPRLMGLQPKVDENNGSPTLQDSTVRKLSFSSSASERRKQAMDSAPDAPSFDLDLDNLPMGDKECNNGDPSNGSIPPVAAHEYQKRLIKNGKFEKSPFIPGNKKTFTVSRGKTSFTSWCLTTDPNLDQKVETFTSLTSVFYL